MHALDMLLLINPSDPVIADFSHQIDIKTPQTKPFGYRWLIPGLLRHKRLQEKIAL